MKFKNILFVIVLFLIISLGFFLRIYKLDQIPAGFFCDEAATGYNAYTISTTGKDEYGAILPAFFRSFDNYRPGIPMYFTVPFVKLFGLNEFSTRLPSAIIGTLTILIIFGLCRLLTSSYLIASLSALFLSISPWHIQFSRYSEGNIYLPFFLILATYFLFLSMKTKKIYLYYLSAVTFALTFYTYFQAYYLVPFFMIFYGFIFKNWILKHKKETIYSLLLFIIFSIPILQGLKGGYIFSRFHQISSATIEKTPIQIGLNMIQTYTAHFRPEFLLEKGDIGYTTHFITRFSVRGMGEIYLIQLPFVLLGFPTLYRKWRKTFLIVVSWLILYPLGSTLAPLADGGGPFASRSIIGVIPFQILTSTGVYFVSSVIKNNIVKIFFFMTIFIIITSSFKTYAKNYFVQYPLYSSDFWGWQYGARDIVKYFSLNKNKYDQLIMAPEFNAPEIFFKFYAPNDCQKCLVGLPSTNYNPKLKQLFAVTPDYLSKYPIDFKTLKTIYYPNNDIAFQIGEVLK